MAHIDWLTIVGRREVDQTDWSVTSAYHTAWQTLTDEMPSFKEVFGCALDWQIVKPRAPYSYARRSDDCTRTLYVHPLASHFTCEVSGQYCQRITDQMPIICHQLGPLLSRIDLAVDIETDVTPVDFHAQTDLARVKTQSVLQSSTGQTVYVGARSSDRFARVYRYYAPHPRAKLLRCEFQLKHDYARAFARAVAEGESLDALGAGLGAHFGFMHPVWTERAMAPARLVVASHAQSGNTIAWLTKTVAPLLRRLEREGKLDVDAWMQEYVKQSLDA